jgi:hypothetical protein
MSVFVPGQGEVDTRAEVSAYHSLMIVLRDGINAAIGRGESEDAVVASKPVADFARPGKGTDRWVRVVYREYKSTPAAEHE